MSPVQWLAIGVALGLLVAVIELVRRGHLTEEYSLIWICSALGVLVLALQRHWLDAAAVRLGIFYPPALLLLGLGGFVLLIALALSVALSRQRRQIERLAEQVALLEAELRQLSPERSIGTVSAGEMVTNAPTERSQARQ